MKFLSSVESWNSFFEWASVWLVALTFIAGAGTVITSRIISRLQTAKIAGLAKDVAEAELRTEQLRKENLELQAAISPRRLTSVQKESFSKFLSGDPGSIAIVSSVQDGESSDFADDLDSALRNAGWQTVRIRNRTVLEYGVFVGTIEGTILRDTQRISDALRSIGIPHNVRTFGEYDEKRMFPYFEAGVLYLVVDHRPPGKSGKK